MSDELTGKALLRRVQRVVHDAGVEDAPMLITQLDVMIDGVDMVTMLFDQMAPSVDRLR